MTTNYPPSPVGMSDPHGCPWIVGIVPGLYIGNLAAAFDQDCLKAHGITAILVIHFCPGFNVLDTVRQTVEENGWLEEWYYFDILMQGSAKGYPDLIGHLPHMCELIASYRGTPGPSPSCSPASSASDSGSPYQGPGVLVCCTEGYLWAAAAILAYLMRAEKCDLPTALKKMRKRFEPATTALIPAAFYQLALWKLAGYFSGAVHKSAELLYELWYYKAYMGLLPRPVLHGSPLLVDETLDALESMALPGVEGV